MKRVYIKTYGCQMNERDSEAVAAMLRERGYAVTDSENDADVILLNTCSVRDMAEQKALGKMSMLAQLKRAKPDLVLGFMGCMAQSRGAELLEQPGVDLVVGTQRFHHVPDYLDQLLAARDTGATGADPRSREGEPPGEPLLKKARQEPRPPHDMFRAEDLENDLAGPFRIVDVAEEAGSESTIKDHVLGTNGDRQVTAYVSIMQGCEMYCSFCIVPYTRGAERSRPIGEIVGEVERLVAQGVKEITLLGQIVTSYGRKTIPKKDGKSAFVQLLEAVHAINGVERIRFTSPHPKGFGDDLVQAYRDLPRLCEHAHLPVQSGSDRILKAMNRGYSRDWYLRVIGKLRDARPGLAISTDIISGYPGETNDDFQQTVTLAREVRFDQAYLFKYSKRRDTPAAEMADQLDEDVKERRNQELLTLTNDFIAQKNRQLVGQTVEILVEGRSEKGGKRFFGRTRTNKIVVFDGGERQRGELLPVRIERANTTTLYGDTAIHQL